jgi:quercetin dioxygenase-like cupin family protein
MKINANFAQSVIVDTHKQAWVGSPMPGVERKPLDRVGKEVARATSIVRYAPNSHFSPHVHNGGEEFFVLEGVFQDEHADYPAGSYVRNPPQSSHTPGSALGCTIFVKLWQFEPDDLVPINTLMHVNEGEISQVLFENKYEKVLFVQLTVNQTLDIVDHKGLEIFVLKGEARLNTFTDSANEKETLLGQHSWFRQAVDSSACLKATTNLQLWIKQDHLVNVKEQIERVRSINKTD